MSIIRSSYNNYNNKVNKMSLERKESITQRQTLNELSVELLKDLIGDEEANQFGKKIEEQFNEAIAKLKKSKPAAEKNRDLFYKIINKFIEKADLTKKISEETENAIRSELAAEETINEDQGRIILDYINACASAGKVTKYISDTVKQYQYKDFFSNKELETRLNTFFKSYLKADKASNLTKIVIDKIQLEFKSMKDYYVKYRRCSVFAVEELFAMSDDQDKLSLVEIYFEFNGIFQKYYDYNEHRFSNVIYTLKDLYENLIQDDVSLFTDVYKTIIASITEALEQKTQIDDSKLIEDFKNYATSRIDKIAKKLASDEDELLASIKHANMMKNQQLVLMLMNEQFAPEFTEKEVIKQHINKIFDSWKNGKSEEALSKIDFTPIKAKLASKIKSRKSDISYEKTLTLLKCLGRPKSTMFARTSKCGNNNDEKERVKFML